MAVGRRRGQLRFNKISYGFNEWNADVSGVV